jgi:hypothetical protein
MVQLGSLVMRYAAEGYQNVIRADKQVRDNVSKTARHAQRDEAKTKNWLQRHKTALLGITGALSGAMYTITKNSPSMSAAIGEIRLAFSMFFMDVGERAAPFFDDLAEATWGLLDEWEKLPGWLKDIIVGGSPELLDHWDELLLSMASHVDSFLGTGDLFKSVTQNVIDNIRLIWNTVTETLRKGWEDFKEDPIAFLTDQLNTINDKITDWLPTPHFWGIKVVSKLIDGILSKVGEIPGVAENNIFGAIRAVWDVFKDGPMAWGKSIMENLIQGIGTGESSLFSTVDSLLDTVAGKFTGLLPNTLQWGGLLVGGLSEGANSNSNTLFGSISSITSTITTTFTNWLAGVKDWGINLINGIVGGISDTDKVLYNIVTAVHSTVTKQFLDWIPNARTWGADLMNHFTGGIKSMFGALSSAVNSARRMVENALSFDVTANDRMAFTWGADLVSHFEAGMRSAQFRMPMPLAAPVSASPVGGTAPRGGDTVYITIETGAVQVTGSEAKTFDERALGRIIRDEIGQALRERAR